MFRLNFLKNSSSVDDRNIIYVLDCLLNIAINCDAINEARQIDVGLYKIMNSPSVYRGIIFTGCLPITRNNEKPSIEFVKFINNLWMYMEYDLNTDSLWSKTTENPVLQKSLYGGVALARKELIKYVYDQQLMSEEVYLKELNYKVKTLWD